MTTALVAAIPLLLLVVAAAANVAIIRRNRRRTRDGHRRPHGVRLLMRGLPFILLGVALGVWGVIAQRWLMAGLGFLSAILLLIEVRNRWRPDAPHAGRVDAN